MEWLLANSVLVNLTRAVKKLAIFIPLALESGYLPHGVLNAVTHVELGSIKLHFQFTAFEPEAVRFLLA